jgi:Cu(I)/Ag(I) efflux system membrane fusion protein
MEIAVFRHASRRAAGFALVFLLAATGCGGPSGGKSPAAKGGGASGLLGGVLSIWDNICCMPIFGPGRAQARPGETPQLALSTERQQLIGVRTEEVSAAPMRRTVRAVGRVEADERKLATVTLKTEGWIETLHADSIGKPVRKGEPVAEYYSPELLTFQQEYLYILESNPYWNRLMIEYSTGDRYAPGGRVTGTLSEPVFQKARDRLKFWGLTEEQIQGVDKNRQPVRTFTVESPVTGYVVEKPVVRGSRVAPGDKIVDIADLSTVWVIADVYASELPYVKAGQEARISIRHFPDKDFPARVDYVYPAVSGATRTTRVRFVVPNPGTLLKPKMFADVSIAVNLGSRLSVPEEAIIDTGVAQVVYVAKGDGKFEPRRIVTGVRADGRAEVVSGLKAGEKVAASGVFLIDSEAKLKGIAN